MSSPPIEWVPGNPPWPQRFIYVESISLAAGITISLVTLLISSSALSSGDGYKSWPNIAASFAIPIILFLSSIPVWWLPRRRPIIRRIGISPVQLSIEYSFRKLTTPWSRVRWKDPLRIEISKGPGTFQFLLSERQAARIRAFFRTNEPLPSSIPRWSGTTSSRPTRKFLR